MSEITYEIKFYPDFPGQDGDEHAFFANFYIGGEKSSSLEFISSHKAESCLIDHYSRISDIEMPDDLLLRAKRMAWANKIITDI